MAVQSSTQALIGYMAVRYIMITAFFGDPMVYSWTDPTMPGCPGVTMNLFSPIYLKILNPGPEVIAARSRLILSSGIQTG